MLIAYHFLGVSSFHISFLCSCVYHWLVCFFLVRNYLNNDLFVKAITNFSTLLSHLLLVQLFSFNHLQIRSCLQTVSLLPSNCLSSISWPSIMVPFCAATLSLSNSHSFSFQSYSQFWNYTPSWFSYFAALSVLSHKFIIGINP